MAAAPLGAQDALIFRDGFETPRSHASCFDDTDPRNAPEGFTQHVMGWEEIFYGQAFPSVDAGGLSPVGSFTFRDEHSESGWPVMGSYFAVPFVPQAQSTYRIEWYRAQTVASRDYTRVHPADAVYVTISPCPGDFRLPRTDVAASDERSWFCRSYNANGVLYYATVPGGSACVLEAGTTYYLNIVFADPATLSPTEDTCTNGTGTLCDALFGD